MPCYDCRITTVTSLISSTLLNEGASLSCMAPEVIPASYRTVLAALFQPATATQLAKRTDLPRRRCSDILSSLQRHNLVTCLSSKANRCRLYWVTRCGQVLRSSFDQPFKNTSMGFPILPWDLYSSVCHGHRAAVIRAMGEPMQPSEIRRKACFRDSSLRMSSNNTRDLMRYLLRTGIIEPVKVRKRSHLRYQLTDLGKDIQTLLKRAEAPF